MTYYVHWVWVGNPISDSIHQKIWYWGTQSLGPGIQPILWVGGNVFDKLDVTPVFGSEKDQIHKDAKVSKLQNAPLVWAINLDDGENIQNFLKQVPGWEKLRAAVGAELADLGKNGLPQVASDIIRVIVLWLLGGAYWDLGDTGPGIRQIKKDALLANVPKTAPAVIPQVLGKNRTENGIIVTNPHHPGDARILYAKVLEWMERMYVTGDNRIKKVKEKIESWRGKLKDDCSRLDNIPETRRNLDEKLSSSPTWTEVENVMLEILEAQNQTEKKVSRLTWATVKENEGLYVTAMEMLFGSSIKWDLIPALSHSVDTHTFNPFVTTAGRQVVPSLGDNAKPPELQDAALKLHDSGWRHVQPFFGGGTKETSWYSWKTRPGRAIINSMAKKADVKVGKDKWEPDQLKCSLCGKDAVKFKRHHCRRCAIFMCEDCGEKVAHKQPKDSSAEIIWSGKEWACLGCRKVISKRN